MNSDAMFASTRVAASATVTISTKMTAFSRGRYSY
jgi:hypothetical protein